MMAKRTMRIVINYQTDQPLLDDHLAALDAAIRAVRSARVGDNSMLLEHVSIRRLPSREEWEDGQ